jgi:phosphoribosylanthranilate isomerase
MSVKVKICGITSVADGLAAQAEAGADMIGLMFYERSPRHISFELATEISRSISPFVLKVGVFVNPEEDDVLRAISECGVNLLQFHGEETPEFCTRFGVMSMKAFRVRDAGSLLALPDYRLMPTCSTPIRPTLMAARAQSSIGIWLSKRSSTASPSSSRAG